MKEILRKCKYCDIKYKKTINVDIDKFVFYEGSYYHYNCFIEKLIVFDNFTKDDAINKADIFVTKTKNSKVVLDRIDQDRLTYWLYDNYNITVLPDLFFQKLKRINEGTFSNKIIVPISCYDLLQIFIKMKTYLDKVNYNNERKGKKISGSSRVEYDLAIVLNNYDEYVKWRQKQQSEKVENKIIKDEIKAKQEIQITQITNTNKINKEEINIADMLDELF